MFADKLTRIGQAQVLVQSWMHSCNTTSAAEMNHMLFHSLPESCHEQILLQIAAEETASSLSTYQTLQLPKYRLLAQVPPELCTNKHFQYVVAHKLLLRRSIGDLFFWRVLVDAMVKCDGDPLQSPLSAVFDVVLERWSQTDFAVNTDYAVNVSVCFFLRYSLLKLAQDGGEGTFAQHDWITKLCKGVQDHMSHSLERVRVLGMRVGESLSLVISSEQPLDFGLKDEDPLEKYGCPVLPDEVKEGVESLTLDASTTQEATPLTPVTSDSKDRARQRHSRKHFQKSFTVDPDELVPSDDDEAYTSEGDAAFESSEYNSDSDSDMSLEAYNLQDDEEDLTAKRPLYLKDLIAGLLSDDAREKTEVALKEAESLVRRRPRDLNDKARDVVRALLRLEDKYSTPQFVKLRSQALAAACALAPTQTLPYLCSQALEREQLLQSRIDVLQAMTSAAQELSERGGAFQRPQPKTLLQEQVDATRDLGARTMQSLKTRRWGYRRDPLATPKRNAFAPHALAFFSPLLFGYNTTNEVAVGRSDSDTPQQAMATVDGSPVSSAKLTELGKALDQTSISAAASPAASHEAPKLPAKSPKKRGRTDSMKKMLPAPASQRHKQVRDAAISSPQSSMQGSSGTEEDSAASPSLGPSHEAPQPQQRPQTQPAKLMVKDRRGSGMGVPRAHLILNAVKQAPPAKEKSNPRRWSKHEDESLRLAVERSGERNWKAIADQVPGRNHTQCLQRWTKVLKPGLIKVNIPVD
ncbi:unnamed protein product [Phytophthora lilii]|uniref:Unnamed protein product n=1 Tax=Phytophthora lilii TaxID=2077276 RepID=A0A9W6UDS7_9STRA|nr:unnamed protein product [Phytophthora lilii]